MGRESNIVVVWLQFVTLSGSLSGNPLPELPVLERARGEILGSQMFMKMAFTSTSNGQVTLDA